MNLFLRPLEDVNDVTWSVIWCIVILLIGVLYYVINILKLAYKELEDGNNDTSKSEELLQFPSDEHR